jgi:frataxin-like iron-binding protein CyaY
MVFERFGKSLQVPQDRFHREALFADVDDGMPEQADGSCIADDSNDLLTLQFFEGGRGIQARRQALKAGIWITFAFGWIRSTKPVFASRLKRMQ